MATALHEDRPTTHAESLSDRLAGAGWGLFFLWIGISILASIPSWIALTGVGAITLGIQAARKAKELPAEGFWVTVGLLFLAAAVWDLAGAAVQLLPVLLIVVGGSVLVSVLVKRKG
jgi:hypothetical protein